MTDFAVCSPTGGYGNHLRWLLLLSDKFDILGIHSKQDKIKFIEQYVYPKTRTCFNWLKFEWDYREKIDNNIKFSHAMVDLDLNDISKIVLLTIIPINALKAYLKINPKMNGHTTTSFCNSTHYINKNNLKYRKETLVVEAEKLFIPTLDKTLYKRLIDYFDLENDYEEANNIHTLWYNLHKQGERDVLRINDGWYYTENIEKPNENEYTVIQNSIVKLYGEIS